MFQTFRNAWKDESLRKKILFTLLILVIFRFGCTLPVPFLDASKIGELMGTGSILTYLDTLSGGALSRGTVFALSIQPFINAQIIIQLLTYALPPLENLQKEGEEGRKKLQKITNVVSLIISLVMAYAYYVTMRNKGAVKYTEGFDGVFTAIVIISVFTAGSSIIVWLGNLINDKGIGNGISILLFAGIVARGPSAVLALVNQVSSNTANVVLVPLVLIVFVLMIGFIVFMNESERRIPVAFAKRVVGRKQYGGQNTHIPIKIAMSGVMPIIFAMSFMAIPATIGMFKPAYVAAEGTELTFWQSFYNGFLNVFSYSSISYAVIYFVLIIAFNYFYVAMQYDPVQMANNLRQNNGGIPGIRPGKPTSDYIKKVLSKITLVGAVFLGVIAILPILFNRAFPTLNISLGGTSILIVVSVSLETVRTLESQLMMRHHSGFLE